MVDYTDSEDLITFDYVGASLVGYNVTDYVSVSESSSISVTDFPFLAIAVQSGLDENHDGVIGFCRQYLDTEKDEYINEPLFLE